MDPIVIWTNLGRNLGSTTTSTAAGVEPPASGTPTQETQPSEVQLVSLRLRVQQGGRISADT